MSTSQNDANKPTHNDKSNPVYHATKGCLSTTCHVRETWTREILAYLKRCGIWYALKHETGERPGHPGKVHLHWVLITEIIDKYSKPPSGLGPLAPGAREQSIKRACPELASHLLEQGCPATLKCHRLISTEFINEYMQKEGDCCYKCLPQDQLALIPYFADLHTKKIASPEFHTMMLEFHALFPDIDKCDITQQHTYDYLNTAMIITHTQKSIRNPIIVENTSNLLWQHLTGCIVPPGPRVKPNKPVKDDTCPRCLLQDRNAPNKKLHRKQFCELCVYHPEWDIPLQ